MKKGCHRSAPRWMFASAQAACMVRRRSCHPAADEIERTITRKGHGLLAAPSMTTIRTAPASHSSAALRVLTPKVFQGTWIEAHQAAQASLEPIFVPVAPFADDRGWSLMNMLNGVMGPQGQVNFSVQYPGIVKAWHRHDKQ